MGSTRRILNGLLLAGAAFVFAACGPTYPKCENDGHCADKGEYCLSGKCSQCRENTHCEGAGMQCSAGQCEQIPGYCDAKTACPGKQKCRDNRCGAECLADTECGEADFCDNGSCASRPECGDNAIKAACAEGKECVSGACQIKITQCISEPVYFDYNKANIKRTEKDKLEAIAQCLQGDNVANVQIAGHCDERGTVEYNLALGQSRADSSKKYLERKGAPADKMSTTSFGKSQPAVEGSNEAAWKKNRRSEFNAQ
jgi:peptidoglycan-associated lipoprotein